jgi:7-keto-8-aminopelargonate synthetase-like enzyme
MFVYMYNVLQSHPAVIEAGIQALQTHGAGLSSVRFICGTMVQNILFPIVFTILSLCL